MKFNNEISEQISQIIKNSFSVGFAYLETKKRSILPPVAAWSHMKYTTRDVYFDFVLKSWTRSRPNWLLLTFYLYRLIVFTCTNRNVLGYMITNCQLIREMIHYSIRHLMTICQLIVCLCMIYIYIYWRWIRVALLVTMPN